MTKTVFGVTIAKRLCGSIHRKERHRMRKITAVACLGCLMSAVLLSACTRKDTSTSSVGTGTQSSSAEGNGSAIGKDTQNAIGGDPSTTLAGGVNAGTGDGSSAGSSTQTQTPAQADPQVSAPAETPAGQASSAPQDAAAAQNEGDGSTGEADYSGVEAENTYDAQNQAGEPIVEDDNDADSWEGTYNGENDEQLLIHDQTESGFYFSFAVCGISGWAEAAGNEATYAGDDSNNIVFQYAGDTVFVSVTNTDGNDTSEAVMAGTYTAE